MSNQLPGEQPKRYYFKSCIGCNRMLFSLCPVVADETTLVSWAGYVLSAPWDCLLMLFHHALCPGGVPCKNMLGPAHGEHGEDAYEERERGRVEYLWLPVSGVYASHLPFYLLAPLAAHSLTPSSLGWKHLPPFGLGLGCYMISCTFLLCCP